MYATISSTVLKYWLLYTQPRCRSRRTNMAHPQTGVAVLVDAVIEKSPNVRVREISRPDAIAARSYVRSFGESRLGESFTIFDLPQVGVSLSKRNQCLFASHNLHQLPIQMLLENILLWAAINRTVEMVI